MTIIKILQKRNHCIRKNCESGFTLMEILVTLAILGMISAAAIPSIKDQLPKYRLKSATANLVANLQRTRLAAAKNNANVVIRFTPGTSTAGSYSIFTDDGSGSGTAGDFIRNGSEEVIASESMPAEVTLSSPSFNGNSFTGFSSRGIPLSQGGSLLVGTVTMAVTGRSYTITLAPSGNINNQVD